MFTGIISEVSKVSSQQPTASGLRITVKKPRTWQGLQAGGSISVDGACLTVEKFANGQMYFFLMPETLQKTTFGQKMPAKVNLERPLRAGQEIGGHFVQGHIDGVGQVAKIAKTKDGYVISISFDQKFQDFVGPKGSIAVNGVSLTLTDITEGQLSAALIPYTLKHTTLGQLEVGDKVNLEFDMLAKQVAQIMKGRK